jgi:hypothetical protein
VSIDQRGVSWTPTPPPFRGRCVEILSPKPDRPVRAYLLSPQLQGVVLHHNPYLGKGRTLPCTREFGHCEGCKERLRQQWKGFFAALNIAKGRLALVEVTPEACRGEPRLLDKEKDKRGLEIQTYRRGAAPNSPVGVLLRTPDRQINLPVAFDVQKALLKIWGLEDYQDA